MRLRRSKRTATQGEYHQSPQLWGESVFESTVDNTLRDRNVLNTGLERRESIY